VLLVALLAGCDDGAWPYGDFALEPADHPVIDQGYSGWPLFTADPGVLRDDDGNYHLFFTSLFCRTGDAWSLFWDPTNPDDCTLDDPLGTIAYAFSSDRGRTWEIRSDPVVLPSESGWDSGDLETALGGDRPRRRLQVVK